MAKNVNPNQGTAVLTCPRKCKSEYQDEQYGPGNRVMNRRQGKTPGYNCTVCSAVI